MSEQIMIVRPDEGPIKQEIVPAVARANALTVTTKDEHGEALEFIGYLGRTAKNVEALFAEPKRAAHAAHKAITAAEKALLDPLATARQIVGRKCDTFEAEQRRIAEEARREAEAKARREEEDRKLAEAVAAEEAGELDIADAILEEPITAPIIHIEPEVAKIAGVGTQARWSAEVTDKAALVRYVAAHPEWLSLLDANLPNLNRLAVAQRAALSIPGVRALSTTVRAVRSA